MKLYISFAALAFTITNAGRINNAQNQAMNLLQKNQVLTTENQNKLEKIAESELAKYVGQVESALILATETAEIVEEDPSGKRRKRRGVHARRRPSQGRPKIVRKCIEKGGKVNQGNIWQQQNRHGQPKEKRRKKEPKEKVKM